MALLEKVHILSTGRVPDATDPTEDEIITTADLDELVDTYDPEIHEAPIVLGHDSDTEPGFLSSDVHPAHGWVERIYRDGKDLFMDVDASDEFKDLLDKKYFKKRSIAYYNRDSRTNPSPGKLSIRHVAYLGATPPRVKGLADKTFSERSYMKMAQFSDEGEGYKVNETVLFQEEEKVATKEEAKEILNNNAKEWLAFILQEGQKGFKGGIKSLDPEPTEENFWLYNKDENQWEGVFVAKDDRRFNFIIQDQGEGDWRMAFRLEEEGLPDLTESSEDEQTAEEESTEMSQMTEDKKVKEVKEEEDLEKASELAEDEKECPKAEEKEEEMAEAKVVNPGGDTKEGEYMDMKKLGEDEMDEYMERFMEKYMEKYMEDEYMENFMESPKNPLAYIAKYVAKYLMKEGRGYGKDHDNVNTDKVVEYTEEEMSELETLREEAKMLREQLNVMKEAKEKEMETEMLGFSEKLYAEGKLTENIIKKEALESLLGTLLKSNDNLLFMSEADNKESLTHIYDGLVGLLDKLPINGEDLTQLGELDIPSDEVKVSKYSEKFSKDSQDFDAQIRKYSEDNKVSYKAAYDVLKRNR